MDHSLRTCALQGCDAPLEPTGDVSGDRPQRRYCSAAHRLAARQARRAAAQAAGDQQLAETLPWLREPEAVEVDEPVVPVQRTATRLVAARPAASSGPDRPGPLRAPRSPLRHRRTLALIGATAVLLGGYALATSPSVTGTPAPQDRTADQWAGQARIALAALDDKLGTLNASERTWQASAHETERTPVAVAKLQQQRDTLLQQRAALQSQLQVYSSRQDAVDALAAAEQQLAEMDRIVAALPPATRRTPDQMAAAASLEEQRDLRARNRDACAERAPSTTASTGPAPPPAWRRRRDREGLRRRAGPRPRRGPRAPGAVRRAPQPRGPGRWPGDRRGPRARRRRYRRAARPAGPAGRDPATRRGAGGCLGPWPGQRSRPGRGAGGEAGRCRVPCRRRRRQPGRRRAEPRGRRWFRRWFRRRFRRGEEGEPGRGRTGVVRRAGEEARRRRRRRSTGCRGRRRVGGQGRRRRRERADREEVRRLRGRRRFRFRFRLLRRRSPPVHPCSAGGARRTRLARLAGARPARAQRARAQRARVGRPGGGRRHGAVGGAGVRRLRRHRHRRGRALRRVRPGTGGGRAGAGGGRPAGGRADG